MEVYLGGFWVQTSTPPPNKTVRVKN